jgi:hypothetical protein
VLHNSEVHGRCGSDSGILFVAALLGTVVPATAQERLAYLMDSATGFSG